MMKEIILNFLTQNEETLSIIFFIVYTFGVIGLTIYNYIENKKYPSGYSDPLGVFVFILCWPIFIPIVGTVVLIEITYYKIKMFIGKKLCPIFFELRNAKSRDSLMYRIYNWLYNKMWDWK